MKYFTAFIVMLSACGLHGCASILPKPTPQPVLYTLNAPIVPASLAEVAAPVSLRILMPQIAPGLETEKIAVRKGGNLIDYYSGVRWAGNVPSLVQSLLVQGFDATGRVQSVSNDLVAVKQGYHVLIEIRDFQTEDNSGRTQVHLSMAVKLIDANTNSIVLTRFYDEMENSESETMSLITAAFDRAWQRLATKLIADMLTALQPVPTSPKQ
jgi:ABC-type uncharacterized transport system auxiliary subunit